MNNQQPHIISRLALVFAVCILLSACENDIHEVQALSKNQPTIEEGKNIDSYLSENGKLRARLTAPVLRRYLDNLSKTSEFPDSLHVDFYNDSMKVESQLSARYGRYLENEDQVFLKDHVVLFNIKGDSMFTEELNWDKRTEKFYTHKKVTISKNFRASLFIGLDGMTCSQDLSDLKLFNIENKSYTVIPDSASNPQPLTPTTTPVIKQK